MRFRPVVPALAGVLLVASCAPEVELPQSSGLGSSDLAPSIKPDPRAAATGQGAATTPKRHRSREAEAAPSRGKPSADASRGPRRTRSPAAAAAAASATAEPATTPVLSASVSDPSGDVQGSLTGAPDQVDVTGATLTRGTHAFTLQVSFAGSVPASDPDKTENVASFYDLDGDGQIDYEVWATLADNGWSGSYVTPDGSRFGADSGVTARPAGRDLVVTFPLAHLRGARAFRWSVGAEWGSYEQLAAGATAKDNAPDAGVVAFPR